MGKKSESKFGDSRLNKTYQDLLLSMTDRHSVILHQLGANKNEETRFRNFINNSKVNPDAILSHHWEHITSDWSDQHLLVISDTSKLSFEYRADREELGYIGPKTNKTGFDIHPAIFLNADTSALQGLGGLTITKQPFARTDEEQQAQDKRRRDKWKIAFEDKERYKWFCSPCQAIANGPGAARYTLLGDRETDIYDLIARTVERGWDFVYRNKTDRRVLVDQEMDKLYTQIDLWPVQHSYPLDVPATKKRSKHEASLEVKFGSVSIVRPKYHVDKSLPTSIDLQVVEVKEKPASVVGSEEPIHWIILTSHPVNTVQQALQIIQWYQWRWTIEELFRTLKKKGLNIEASQVETFHGLANLTTLGLLAAVQTMQLVKARDGQTLQKMEDVFFQPEQQCLLLLNQKLEGNTDKTKNPFDKDSLAFASWVIARLGGWNGYKKARPPGPITMIRGLNRFYDMLQGYYLIL